MIGKESVLDLLALLANTKVAMTRLFGPVIQKGSSLLRVSGGRFVKDRVILIFLSMQYGGLRLLPKLAFWLRQLPRGKCLQKRCLSEETSSWLVDVLCVFKRKNRLTTFLFIVGVSPSFGICHSPY